MCGKRLVGVLRYQLAVLVKFGELRLAPEVQAKLERISAATIDRLLRADKRKLPYHTASRCRPHPQERRAVDPQVGAPTLRPTRPGVRPVKPEATVQRPGAGGGCPGLFGAGRLAGQRSSAMSGRWFPPAASIRKSSTAPLRSELNTMAAPSGDQLGKKSWSSLSVSWRTSVPSALTT